MVEQQEKQKLTALRLPESPSTRQYQIWPAEFSSDLSDVQFFLQSPYDDFRSNIARIHEFFRVIDTLIGQNARLDSEILHMVIPVIEMFQEKLRKEGKLGHFRHYGRIRQLSQYIKHIKAQLPEIDDDIFENQDRLGEQLAAVLGDKNQVHIESDNRMAQEIEKKRQEKLKEQMNSLNSLLDLAQATLSRDFSLYSEYVSWFDVPEESKHLLSVPELGLILKLYQDFLAVKDKDNVVASVFRTWTDRVIGFSIIATDIIENESETTIEKIHNGNLLQEIAHTVHTLTTELNNAPVYKEISLDQVLRKTLRGILRKAA